MDSDNESTPRINLVPLDANEFPEPEVQQIITPVAEQAAGGDVHQIMANSQAVANP